MSQRRTPSVGSSGRLTFRERDDLWRLWNDADALDRVFAAALGAQGTDADRDRRPP
jgi:hypothetical protein